MIPEVKCVSCRYFDRNECRRFPDSVSINDFDWCGEYRRSSKWTADSDAALDKILNPPPPPPPPKAKIDEITVKEMTADLKKAGIAFQKGTNKKAVYNIWLGI